MGVHSVPLNLQIGLDPPLPEPARGSLLVGRGVGRGIEVGAGVAVATADPCSLVGCGVGVSRAGSLVAGGGIGVAVVWAARVGGGASVLGTRVAGAVAAAVGVVAGADVAARGAGVGEDASPQATMNNETPTTASPNTKLRILMNRC